MSRILTTAQVAEKLQVSTLTARNYLNKGLIPGKKLGREWRVVESELVQSMSNGIVSEIQSEAKPRISARGFLAGSNVSVERFLAEKHEDNEREEARNSKRWESK